MSKTPFMPLWVSDFLGDTLDLDATEIGAYMLLLMAQWQRDGRSLPEDKLQRVARIGRNWSKIWANLQGYFETDEDGVYSVRLRLEAQNVASKREVNAQNGARGGKSKSLKSKEVTLANATDSLERNSKRNASIPEPYKYIFEKEKWFSEADEVTLQAMHPNIDVAAKLSDEGFRKWSFEADPSMPTLAAKNWFQKQTKIREGTEKLAKIIQINEPANPSKRLQQSRMMQ